jgi:4,5-dihydroxyphthalate decarboxylase
MANLHLSLVLSNNDRTQPIIDGTVRPDAIDLAVSTLHPSEMFWRQLHFAEFDVSEMSISSLLMAVSRGDDRWVALPVFTSRRFFHTGVLVRRDAGIATPQDLKGRRIAVPEYQQTAALWARAALLHEFGVRAQDMEWFMERSEERSHGGATGFQPPEGVRLQRIPPEKSIASMLLAGEIDASLLYISDSNLVDRSRVDISGNPTVVTLFPNPAAEGARYYAGTGFFPINHCVVVQRRVYEANPWVVLNLFNAFTKARDLVARRTAELAGVFFDLGLLPQERRSVLKGDPFLYGVKSNRALLEAIAGYSHEQGLTPRVLKPEEVFAPQTIDL